MKLIMESWRRYLTEMTEMAFRRDTKNVVGFDFDHTLARTSGGQVAYFDPGQKFRSKPGGAEINPKYFEIHPKRSDPKGGGKNAAAAAPISDADIAKLLAMVKENPDAARKLVLKYMGCNEKSKEPFWAPTQAQLDFFTQTRQWQPLWVKNPEQRPNCWAFDFSSRDVLGWEQGTPEASQQIPVMKAFKEAVKAPNTEVIILTSRKDAIKTQIAQYLKDVNVTVIPMGHIAGVAGKSKGDFIYREVLSNEKDYDIKNFIFYDDSEANIATISQSIQKAINDGLIEGYGKVYRVEKHKGNYELAFEAEGKKPDAAAAAAPGQSQSQQAPEAAAGQQDETPI